MSIERWDPWSELEQVRLRAADLWSRALEKMQGREGQGLAFFPDADLVESDQHYRIYLLIPGMVEDDIEILVDRRELIVRGERMCPHDAQAAKGAQIECRYGFFERRFHLATTIHRIHAQYESGMLTITVSKGGQDGG